MSEDRPHCSICTLPLLHQLGKRELPHVILFLKAEAEYIEAILPQLAHSGHTPFPPHLLSPNTPTHLILYFLAFSKPSIILYLYTDSSTPLTWSSVSGVALVLSQYFSQIHLHCSSAPSPHLPPYLSPYLPPCIPLSHHPYHSALVLHMYIIMYYVNTYCIAVESRTPPPPPHTHTHTHTLHDH